jgi:hypothetical protein
MMRKPLQQQTFAKLGLYRKNPYLKQGISHLEIRYIFVVYSTHSTWCSWFSDLFDDAIPETT